MRSVGTPPIWSLTDYTLPQMAFFNDRDIVHWNLRWVCRELVAKDAVGGYLLADAPPEEPGMPSSLALATAGAAGTAGAGASAS